MKLVGTLICYGSAFAIYSERQPPQETIAQWSKALYERENLFIGPEYKLLMISDEAPPTVIDPDLSESLYDREV